ncbi:MAG: glycerophosphodiester phosphodiesterase [Candidatus Omnitrophica bacterium]|nr:glycerophosphodiester phosphodiesterase [Candidatus Omnitrophota bacterium]
MTWVIGHRGCAYEPENTIRAIKKAMEFGVDAVEIDVHLSKDNELVVIHDERLDRTTNGKGMVKDFTFEELRRLDAGKGERIPTLQEAIDTCRGKVQLLVELKVLGSEGNVLKKVEDNKFRDDAYIISFWHQEIKRVRELDRDIKTGILFVGHPVNPSQLAQDARANALVLNYKFISKDLVRDAHKSNLKVFVWNVDTQYEAKDMLNLEVDGIASNKPDIVLNCINNQTHRA